RGKALRTWVGTNSSSLFLPHFLAPFSQDPGDRGHGIPVARRDRYPKEPVERAEVADNLHVAPVHAEDEPVLPRQNLQQPRTAGRKAHRHRWHRARTV